MENEHRPMSARWKALCEIAIIFNIVEPRCKKCKLNPDTNVIN